MGVNEAAEEALGPQSELECLPLTVVIGAVARSLNDLRAWASPHCCPDSHWLPLLGYVRPDYQRWRSLAVALISGGAHQQWRSSAVALISGPAHPRFIHHECKFPPSACCLPHDFGHRPYK